MFKMANYGRRRFSLTQTTSTNSIFPQDNEETIYNTKPPLSPGLDLSDSVCSLNSSGSVRRRCESETVRQDNDNVAYDFCSGSNYNSEPEDMQDYVSIQNKSSVNTVDCINCINSSIEKDKSIENMADSDDFGPFVYTSSPLALRGKKVSLSLQDMSSIETFPLLPKTNNGFSSDTIPSQSLSSTSKSKDSGFQRSASCLSLNSGNRTYDHVQSKVKQYIRDIKNSEESRKRQKQAMIGLTKDSLVSEKKSDTCSINSIAETVDNDSELVRSVSVLKDELREKDSTLKQLQENYNSLLQKYAEAVNQIDLMRLRNSLNNSYRSDFTVSNEDLTENHFNYSKNVFSAATTSTHNNTNRFEKGHDYTSSLPNRLSSLSTPNVHDQYSEEVTKEPFKPLSESLDYQIFSKQDSIPLGKSLTKEDRPQSSSSSTLVSGNHGTKTLTLRPISKYYSSSSRLGKKEKAPLPSSKLGKVVSFIEKSPQDRTGSQKNSLHTTTDDRKDSPLRSYRMRNISKVHPFERVQSYLENFKKMREDSLPTKIDSNQGSSSDDSLNQAYDSHFIEANRSRNNRTSQSKLPNHEVNRGTNRSKSEQNLFSNQKIFSEHSKQNGKSSMNRRSDELFYSNKHSNAGTNGLQLRGSEKHGKKCSKNLLAQNDAFDSQSSLDENLSDNVDDFERNVGFESKEKHLTDDSSSISSSIFSLPKDDGYPPPLKKNNSRSVTETDWKNVSHTKSVKSTVWEKRKSCQSQTSLPKRKKPDRVCYSPKNRREPERKTPTQEDIDFKPHISSSNKKTEFRQKLKIYTEILKSKPNRDIGVQVTDVKDDANQLEDSEDLSNVNRLDCLNEASEYLKQMKQGMDRLCDYIENLKVDSVNKRTGRLEGRL